VTSGLVPPAAWVDEGVRAAPALEDVTAAIITGRDPVAAAWVALGIARAHGTERRVAVADLVGGIPALNPIADQPGLLECLRDGEPISGIGQPLADAPEVYLLPAGRGAINERWVFESARWARLVAGFREVDALLLVVCLPTAPGLATLMERVDGVVAVDLPPADVRMWPLLATVDHPEPELPPIQVRRAEAPAQPAAQTSRGLRRFTVLAVTLGGLALAVAGAGAFWWWNSGSPAVTADAEVLGSPPPAPEPIEIEVHLGPPVNPEEAANAAIFAVELVAANTLASANSALVSRTGDFPAATVAPVLLGTTARPWFRALSGAWQHRGDAEAWLASERARGVLRASVGRVVAVPFALLLAELSAAEADDTIARWEAAGIRAYALEQEDGSVRIYAGAFETAGQAVWLASTLRDAGETPRLAYRTGRAF
jgi:predicted component of type VI protein secretion system